MIFYKRKNKLQKLIKFITKRREIKVFSSFKLLKNLLSTFCFLLLLFYVFYLLFLPKIIDEKKAELIINSLLSQKTKFILDIDNLKISPNYKFDIVMSADKAKLKYCKDKDFLILDKPFVDINIFTLLFGHVDLNNIKTKKISLNTNFTKNNRYSCFDYIDFLSEKKQQKFKLRNIHLLADELEFNLYDENVKKSFYIRTKKIKLNTNGINKPFLITTAGVISSSDHKISDFVLKLEYKLRDNAKTKLKDRISKLNYNPLKFADKYKFYSKSNIDLKIYPINENQNITGKIALNDYSFNVENMRLPKNNTEILFRGDKILFDSNFNLIKNQFIKLKSNINIAKNKYIETTIKSNDINLADLKLVLNVLFKVFNSKFDIDNLELSGALSCDLYLKSNFKTILSSGNMLIKNAGLSHKVTGLILKNINSNVNFENNIINIEDTYAYIDSAKFYLNGKIDNKTNLSLVVDSDLINVVQIINFLKAIPFASEFNSFLKEYDINSGYLKINSKINGNIDNPIIKTNSKIQNLKIYSKRQNLTFESPEMHVAANPEKYKIKDISVLVLKPKLKLKQNVFTSPKMNFYIKEKDIEVAKALIEFENFKFVIEGIIKDYKTKNLTSEILLFGKFPDINSFIKIKNKNTNLKAKLIFKEDKINIVEGNLIDENSKIIVSLNGDIFNKDELSFQNIKLTIFEKINIMFPKMQNLTFDAIGALCFSGKTNRLSIDGNLNISNLRYEDLKLEINDLLLNLKNSKAYLNVLNGKILNQKFDLVSECEYLNKKVIFKMFNISMPYFDATQLNKIAFTKNNKDNLKVEILDLSGNIDVLNVADMQLNNVNFNGDYKDNIIKLSNFTSSVFDGSMNGTVKLDSANKKVTTGIILKDINVRELSNEIKQFSIAATGRLDAIIDADFIGYEFIDIIKSLDGYVRFNIKNGELSQFAKLERFLQAGNILSQSILKLSLNSAVSTLTKQNTGKFESIEGVVRVKNSWAEIKHIKTIGANMSLYLTGGYNLLNQYCDVKILGRIPTSIASVMGNIGQFSTSKIVDKMSNEAKNIIESITVSPFEKMMSTIIPESDLINIPPLYNAQTSVNTREFIVFIEGVVNNANSIKYFKWHSKN